MAFRELVEGDCGGPNSLMRLTSHFVKDHAFKEEGLYQPFGGPSETLQTLDSEQLVQQFLEETTPCPQTFRMENLLQEMREIDQNIHPPIAAPGVAKELAGLDSSWATQYLESGKHFDEHHADDVWNPPTVKDVQEKLNVMETHELGLGPKWAEEYIEHSVDNMQIKKDQDEATNQMDNKESLDGGYSKFMKFMRQEGDIPIVNLPIPQSSLHDTIEGWADEFDEVKQDAQDAPVEISATNVDDPEILSKVDEELAVAGTWVEEFTKENVSSADGDEVDPALLAQLQETWEKAALAEENLDTSYSSMHPWISEYSSYYDPFKSYTFHENNPMKELPNALEEGKKRLEVGDLPGAVLCFEAAVQQDENSAESWFLLGRTQAENEQDPLAISALKRCLSLDSTNGAALMALAVSYTNESYQYQACLTLKEWLLKNEKYKHLSAVKSPAPPRTMSSVSTILFDDVHEEVKNLYIEAARMNPRNEIDPDVQCGLGVLFNLSSEYDKAVDCFEAALQVRPDDSRLWNRLGATLANGRRSEEAINAYHRALELSPGFIRARYNLGISCVNLHAYKEAAEHILIALNQQAAGRGAQGESASPKSMSNTIWSMLRLVVSLHNALHVRRHELCEAAEKRDLATLNKEFGIM